MSVAESAGGPTVSVDMGGTVVKLSLVDEGRVVDARSLPAASSEGLGVQMPALVDAVRALCRDNAIDVSACRGIGLSMPGLIDSTEARVLSINEKYEDAPDFDFRAWASEAIGLPLKLENDAHAALLGEWRHGAGRGVDDVVMVTLGTGYGTSVVIGGRLLRGRHHQAGVLGGHLTIRAEGRPCNCGSVGCIEAETSTWALPGIIRSHPSYPFSGLSDADVLDYRALFRAAADGDELAMHLRDRSLRLWSLSLVNLVHAYDPERIVMGGGIMNAADLILPVVREYVYEHAWTPWGDVEIVPAQHGDHAALLGMHVAFNEELSVV